MKSGINKKYCMEGRILFEIVSYTLTGYYYSGKIIIFVSGNRSRLSESQFRIYRVQDVGRGGIS